MRQFIAISILFAIGFSPVGDPMPEPPIPFVPPLPSEPPVQTGPAVFATEDRLVELAAWALVRFDQAGLDLPPVEIHLHRTDDQCGGHRGTFNPGRMRIDVCVEAPGVILHELAHAWAHHDLDEATRDAYVAFRGLESWNDPDTPWLRRGSEDAADTVAWALQAPPLSGFIPDGLISQNHEAYRLLTGSTAPAPDDGAESATG